MFALPEKLSAIYDYRDEVGQVLYQVLRFEPKAFRQRARAGGGWRYNLEGTRRVPYRLPELLVAPREVPVYVVEGEKDVASLVELGLVATTFAGGSAGWRPEYAEHFRGRTVIILPDNDPPGQRFAETVRAALRGIAQGVRIVNLPDLPAKGDVTDWLQQARGLQPAEQTSTDSGKRRLLETVYRSVVEVDRAAASPAADSPSKPAPQTLVRILEDVPASDIHWLWPGVLPAGKLVLLEGDPGEGKSLLSLDLAARLSTGRPWPDDSGPPRPGNTLLIIAEDGVEDIAKPRLQALGADMTRIVSFDGFLEDGQQRTPSFPRDTQALERLIRDHQAELVILDPLAQFVDRGFTTNNDQLIRQVLLPMAKVAEQTGSTLLVIRHLNKTAGGRAIYRGSGSIGIIGTSRCAYLVARDPHDRERRVFANIKMNLAPPPPALAFRLIQEGQQVRLHWEGRADVSADELVGVAGKRSESALKQACELLQELLANGPVEREVVLKRVAEAGISEATLKRARQALGVLVSRQGLRENSRFLYTLLRPGSDAELAALSGSTSLAPDLSRIGD